MQGVGIRAVGTYLLSTTLLIVGAIMQADVGWTSVPASTPGATEMSEAVCRPDVSTERHRSKKLANGVHLEIRSGVQRSVSPRTPRQVRLAVVKSASARVSLSPRMSGPPDLIDPRTVARGPSVISVINGDYFDDLPGSGTIPRGMVVSDGRILFAPARWTPVVAVDSGGIPRTTRVKAVLIDERSPRRTVAVNDPLDPGRGITVYTAAWQRDKAPTDVWRLVIDQGIVTALVRPSRNVSIPDDGFVLASHDRRRLQAWPVGTEFSARLQVASKDGRAVQQASGHGGVVLRDGTVKAPCSEYENLLRPRTALAWNDKGTVWLMTVTSGMPDPADGFRRGGGTKSQVAAWAKELGAQHAVTLDGGGSTVLFTHRAGKVQRRDLPASAWTRPVPVVWTLTRGVTMPRGSTG